MARIEDIENIQLNLITAEGAVEDKSVSANSLWQNQPVLFLIIRRPGCIACRELAHELSEKTDKIASSYGVKLVAIVKENLADDVAGFREFFTGPIYLDAKLSFYKSLTDGVLVKHSALGTLMKPAVWAGINRAMKKGIKSGSFAGEATINGGILLVSSKGVHYQYNEVVARLPSFNEIIDAMKEMSGNIETVISMNGNVKRPVCNDEVCVRT